MDSDIDQILLLVGGFFGALTFLLVALDRLESSIDAPPSSLSLHRHRLWRWIARPRRR